MNRRCKVHQACSSSTVNSIPSRPSPTGTLPHPARHRVRQPAPTASGRPPCLGHGVPRRISGRRAVSSADALVLSGFLITTLLSSSGSERSPSDWWRSGASGSAACPGAAPGDRVRGHLRFDRDADTSWSGSATTDWPASSTWPMGGPRRPVVLRPHVAVAVPAPLVAGDRGAVLPVWPLVCSAACARAGGCAPWRAFASRDRRPPGSWVRFPLMTRPAYSAPTRAPTRCSWGVSSFGAARAEAGVGAGPFPHPGFGVVGAVGVIWAWLRVGDVEAGYYGLGSLAYARWRP
jgi:hypothetical protein